MRITNIVALGWFEKGMWGYSQVMVGGWIVFIWDFEVLGLCYERQDVGLCFGPWDGAREGKVGGGGSVGP